MPEYISYLPHLNAILNTTSFLLLITGYRFIRAGFIRAHRNCQIAALVTSTCFLISYLTYHYYHGDTPFPGQGIVRPFYFAILITHVILAIVIVPLVVITVYRAARGDFIPAPQDSSMDITSVALRFGDWRNRLLDAVSHLSVGMSLSG